MQAEGGDLLLPSLSPPACVVFVSFRIKALGIQKSFPWNNNAPFTKGHRQGLRYAPCIGWLWVSLGMLQSHHPLPQSQLHPSGSLGRGGNILPCPMSVPATPTWGPPTDRHCPSRPSSSPSSTDAKPSASITARQRETS